MNSNDLLEKLKNDYGQYDNSDSDAESLDSRELPHPYERTNVQVLMQRHPQQIMMEDDHQTGLLNSYSQMLTSHQMPGAGRY